MRCSSAFLLTSSTLLRPCAPVASTAMQSARHLLAAARLSLSATRSAISASPVCFRCGRCVSALPIPPTPIRLFARKAQSTDENQPTPRKTKRTAASSAPSSSTSNVAQPAEKSSGDSELMRLLAQLPAADVPAAIAALNQRLAGSRKKQAEVIQAEVEVEDEAEEKDDEEDEDENEAEYAVLRARLAKEGSVTTEAGEEIISMEEVERQLAEDGELDEADDEAAAAAADAEEEEDEELIEEEEEGDEAEQILEEGEEAEELQSTSRPQRSVSNSSSKSASNTFWIQERRDGTVTVTEWPFADDDEEDSGSDLSSTYDLNMPSTAAQQAGIVGQNIGGEKLRRADVLQMREKDLTEHFTKGGGRGGQKVNKTSNCVHLHHVPTGTIVKCHATRSLAENRRIAREIMQGRLEELMLGPASKNAQRAAKIRKKKAKTRRRAAIKYGETDEVVEGSNTQENGTASNQQPTSTRGSGSE